MIQQVAFEVPADMAAKLAAGEYVQFGGVVRNLSGRIVKHLRPLFLSDGSRKSHDEKTAQLEQVVTEYEAAMKEGDYDTALIKANQLYGDGYSRTEDDNWDNRREAYIELINEKKEEQELDSPDTIYVAADASSFKGKNSSDVVTQFANMGFTNVTAQQSTSSAGWFDGDMTVEHVLVGGSTDFSSGDHFNKDDPVIVYYYKK